MRYSGLVLCALVFIVSCNSNQASEEDINKILEQLEDANWGENVDHENYDEIVYDVEIVTAPNKVEELALEVNDLIEAKRIDDRW